MPLAIDANLSLREPQFTTSGQQKRVIRHVTLSTCLTLSCRAGPASADGLATAVVDLKSLPVVARGETMDRSWRKEGTTTAKIKYRLSYDCGP